MNDIKSALPHLNEDEYNELEKMGLSNVGTFLSKVSDKKNRLTLSRVLKIEEKKIEKWIKELELYRLNSLDNKMIAVLRSLGLKTLKDIAKKTTSELYELLKNTKQLNRISIAYIDEIISEARFSSMRIG